MGKEIRGRELNLSEEEIIPTYNAEGILWDRLYNLIKQVNMEN